jgi:uncharacterized membrane protein
LANGEPTNFGGFCYLELKLQRIANSVTTDIAIKNIPVFQIGSFTSSDGGGGGADGGGSGGTGGGGE